MNKLTQHYKAATAAVDTLATSPGVTPGDRAARLAELRTRLSDHIARLSGGEQKRPASAGGRQP